jgi:hypothetical protein
MRMIRGRKLDFLELFSEEVDLDTARSLQVYQAADYQYTQGCPRPQPNQGKDHAEASPRQICAGSGNRKGNRKVRKKRKF